MFVLRWCGLSKLSPRVGWGEVPDEAMILHRENERKKGEHGLESSSSLYARSIPFSRNLLSRRFPFSDLASATRLLALAGYKFRFQVQDGKINKQEVIVWSLASLTDVTTHLVYPR